ncbi:MAG: tyrosine-type recombinase/integrase [Cyclobacteriaceae bacterium]
MDTAIIILPALIRLLYATGLRISEALALKDRDLNLTDNYLIVRDSKNGKERLIPISSSLSEVLSEYVRYKKLLPLSEPASDHLFITLSGSSCNTDHVRKWFKKILGIAGISLHDQGPRLHDLRHTFSVHSLAMMAEAGIDLYCSLPTLSTYLGHQSLEATNAYVRLTGEMYPGLLKDVDLICLNVFPNTEYYAAY